MPEFLDLIEKAPSIFWTPRNGGHWVVLPYQAQLDAFRNWEVFSSEHFSPEEYEEMMAALPPEQRVPPRSRSASIPHFSPSSAPRWCRPSRRKPSSDSRAQIRDLAERLIGDIADNGRCEFMHEVADLYPGRDLLADVRSAS